MSTFTPGGKVYGVWTSSPRLNCWGMPVCGACEAIERASECIASDSLERGITGFEDPEADEVVLRLPPFRLGRTCLSTLVLDLDNPLSCASIAGIDRGALAEFGEGAGTDSSGGEEGGT